MTTELASVDPVFDNGRTRIWRSLDSDGTARIHKEALGHSAVDRIAHETSILRRLDGVPGIPKLQPSLDPCVLIVADPGARMLAEVLAERRLPASEVVDLGERLARVLAAVHDAGVAHHDLHPWNVLVAADGCVELIDFDLATTTAEVRPGFTHHREILGRLPYLSPEQTGRTGSAVDQRSDLYALGAVLYEAATGRPPFLEQDAFELLREILTREPAPIGRLDPTMPPMLDAAVARLLEKEPDRRYQSAGGLAHDLARIAAQPAASFPLGERDFPSRLSPPTRLVGRETEIAVLAQALDAVTRPAGQLGNEPSAGRVVLVCGGPGVGKSALANTLRPLVTRCGGWFVAAKADQLVRDSSSGLRTVLGRLAQLLLAESPADLEAQARTLTERLGSNAAALVAVAPEFAQVLDKPDTADVDDLEIEDRTRQAVLQLLRTVASPARPIVLFLDDVQWATTSTLGVFDAVVDDPDLSGLLVVGAYRDHDDENTPLAAMAAAWARRGVEPTTLRLSPLGRQEETDLIGQVLRLPTDSAAVLAGVIGDRTAGNPFDTIELLNSLRDDGALELAEVGWVWDTAAIRHHVGRGDVVSLLAARIENLGPDAAHALGALALLGGAVTRTDLATACGWTTAQAALLLTRPLEAGLLTTIRYGHPGKDAELRFRHDRVQQASLSLLGTEERQLFQAQMGRRLAAAGQNLPAASQLLAADARPRHAGERALLVRLYRAASDHERLQANFAAAERYLAAAARILADEPTPVAEREYLAVESQRHQVLYQLGRYVEADDIYASLCAAIPDAHELAHVTGIQVASLTNRQQTREAVELGLALLARLGLRFPQHDTQAEVARGLAEVAAWAAGLHPTVDVDRPALSDPVAAARVAVMGPLSVPAYLAGSPASGWLVVQAKRLWEEHGPDSDLMAVLGHGPGAFTAELDDYAASRTLFAHLIATGEARGWDRAVAYSRFHRAVSSSHWFTPLDVCVAGAREAKDGLLHVGDPTQACWSYFPLVQATFETAPTLDHTLAEIAAAVSLSERTGCLPVRHSFSVLRLFCRAAQEVTAGPVSAWGLEEPGVEAVAEAVPAVDANLRLFRSIAAALVGDPEQLAVNARAAHTQARQRLPGCLVTLMAAVPFGLDLSLALRRLPPGHRAHAAELAELDQLLEWLRRRALDQPDNVAHLVSFLEAERAWALGDHDGATAAFDAALGAMQGLSRPWHHALLARRAGELHREHGLEHTGRLLLAEARQALLDWGADALATELERTYPFLRQQHARRSGIASASTPSSATIFTPDAVDTTAILRVAQALAAQTTMAQLHGAIVDQLSAITGATNVRIVLVDDADGWRVHSPTGGADPALDEEPAAALLPVSAVRYVLRTRETLAVDDATTDDRFARDPYLRGKHRLALLVVPVLRSGDLRAVLVLENRLTSGTFTPDRLGFVGMLTGQLAVALDNALIYASLERRIAERTDELRTANAQLELLSSTDALTGVANRRSFDAALTAEWTRSAGVSISVIMIDVDHFKKYNDHLGHPAGDACLIEVSRLLARTVRDTDLLCRYGGEEFAVILPRADLGTALEVAERMRTAVEGARLPHAPTVGVVTVSIGVAHSRASAASTVSELLAGADTALYDAKRGGRNRVRARVRSE